MQVELRLAPYTDYLFRLQSLSSKEVSMLIQASSKSIVELLPNLTASGEVAPRNPLYYGTYAAEAGYLVITMASSVQLTLSVALS